MDAWQVVGTVAGVANTLVVAVALYFGWQAAHAGRDAVREAQAARREEAAHRAEERRLRDEERRQEVEYRAALREERERDLQAEADVRRRERLTRIAQLVTEVRDAGWRVGGGAPNYLLDTAQWRLRAALLTERSLKQCRDLAYLRQDTAGTIVPQVGHQCVDQSRSALEEVAKALDPAFTFMEREGPVNARPRD